MNTRMSRKDAETQMGKDPDFVAPAAIHVITAKDTIAIRWPVLRPGFPRESAIFAGDELTTAKHFGASFGGTLIGVASIYPAPLPEKPDASPSWQLRGMATLPEMRHAGFGRALLAACVAHTRAEHAALLWCNARTSAAPFYAKNGWQIVGGEFDIPTVGPHFRMFIELR
jgi:GNAT superfamily N-acetyltransferase